MKTFHVSCRDARQVGAIGIFYPVRDIVKANDENEAETLFRQKYETRFGPVVVVEYNQLPTLN